MEYAARLVDAGYRLDACKPLASRENLTPLELDRIAPRGEHRPSRARFYREVCEEQERIARLPCNARDRRKLTREAIWNALEQRDLVQRTRGGMKQMSRYGADNGRRIVDHNGTAVQPSQDSDGGSQKMTDECY